MIGWVVLVVVFVAGLHARARVRSGRPYEGATYRVAGALVDVAMLLGIALWVDGRWWELDGRFVLTWLHPALALATLVVAHLGLRRARDERWAAEAYAIAGRTLLATSLLLALVGGIAVQAA